MGFKEQGGESEKGLIEAVNEQAGELIHLLRCSRAPDSVLAEATAHLQAAMSSLAPYLEQGEGWSVASIASDTPGLGWLENDLTHCMPYSPVSGRRNPVAPSIRMWRDGGEVRGEALFSATYAGPPNSVHGGVIAAVFDELLSMANVISGAAGFTGTLTVKYHRHTPLQQPIELWAVNDRNTGRKQFSRAEMRVDGEVTASAEGLFILPASASDEP
ncbi:PaaI family thioesterase [Pseudohalioglobus sediminis]|uniref:PaaI family thioesterase n=1 Tax=Pseudohalioglobus sediminis TaxID=2606449 RepID=A0A5B0WT29_9GAMM|nr:PaaI family thioesterase [Pseudohalioglobus sediminis]KAA1190056.1 PaaI family thioesterase [Pseudohalioglobus sediminis]